MAGKRRRRARTGNRAGMAAITGVIVVLLVMLTVLSQDQIARNKSYAAQQEALEAELKDEQIRGEEISELKEYVKTDEFIEKTAREKFGFVYEDEIVFKPVE